MREQLPLRAPLASTRDPCSSLRNVSFASVNFIVQLGFVGGAQYPLWALTVQALTLVVLYALIARWDEAREPA